MPAPIYYAHKILKLLSDARKSGAASMLGPDAKSQVTVEYENGKAAARHPRSSSPRSTSTTSMTSDDVRAVVEPYVMKALPAGWVNGHTEWHVNPTGKFVIGGPRRRLRPDRPQDHRRHLRRRQRRTAGGAFSGKDPTKVDRSAAYAARYPRQECRRQPISPTAAPSSFPMPSASPSRCRSTSNLHGTGKVDEAKLEGALGEVMDLSPRGIRQHLKLNRRSTLARPPTVISDVHPEADGGFSWERTDLAGAPKSALS